MSWLTIHLNQFLSFYDLAFELSREKTLTSGLMTRSDTNWTVWPQKIWLEAWNFRFWKWRDCTIYVAKQRH